MATRKNRILFTASSAPRYPGDITAPFILNMAQDLCALGWQVDILAPHAEGLAKQEKIGAVDIFRFPYMWPESWQTLCYQGGALSNLRKSKLTKLQIPFFMLAEAAAMQQRAKKGGYDLIHSHWLIPQGYIGQKIARWNNLPHVVSVHGADIYTFRSKMIMPFKKAAIENSDAVIANSSATKAEILKISDEANIMVAPTGTTPHARTASSLKREDFCPADTKLIAFLGRIVEEKGLVYLIGALPTINEQQKTKLLVIGDGPERGALERHVATMGLKDKVVFVGAVPHEKIYDYLSLADVFVGPSVSLPSGWVEAQGNTFVEAMFAGLPVVASNIGGIPDAVIDGETGLLVPEKAPAAIAAAVIRLLADPDLAQRLAENGHKHAHAGFSRHSTAQKIAALYEDILSKRAAS